MDRVTLPQGTVEYRAAGPADSPLPAVVFVHGLLVDGELWTAVADRLAERGIRSYAPTLPLGAHRVPLQPDADLGPAGIAALLRDFLAALELTDVTLVGNDTGGALCQFLVDADHSRVGRLVLTNCDAFDEFPPAPFGMLVTVGKRRGGLRLIAESVRPRFLRHSVLAFGGLVRDPLDPALSRRWITPALENPAIRRDARKFLREVRPADLLAVSSRLDRFGKPTLVLWGDADPFFKPAFGRRLRDTIPGATLVEIETGRTFLALDEPRRVADEIAEAFYPVA
ncbi:Pimeloyl-ACP methyl ester carboxylesterase [Jatrophihabitans endophyticus]|uniref:Pimeloyl-ACP methyl ester carboxylesterase n=1 Tax=Jatrophihabitans endophyticus TaxID=1206085 RepID=A0A1M5UFZ8_9ACTN|nr:alpha/beta fold hydrolase [Jatrophihabitans endophyticus]SHH61975.1 Pimeloyl-ACP methyl ester carboxylesterase [Jatrophihabitans endophyticus]